jgi:hypothetical protein
MPRKTQQPTLLDLSEPRHPRAYLDDWTPEGGANRFAHRVLAETVHGKISVTVFRRGDMPGDRRMTVERRNTLDAQMMSDSAGIVRDAINEYLDRHPEARAPNVR